MNSTRVARRQAELGDVASIQRHAIHPQSIVAGTHYVGLEHIDGDGEFQGVPQVPAGHLLSTKFAFSSRHLLYGKLRPYLRKIARPHFAGVCSTDILPILPGPDLDRDYLFHFLRQPEIVEYATSRCSGANLPRLSPAALARLSIHLPPLAEQKRIAAILDKADELRRKRREAIAKLDTLIQSIFLDMFGDPVTNPKGWKVAQMGDLMRIRRGGSPRPIENYLGGTYNWIKIGDATSGDSIYIDKCKEKISEAGLGKTVLLEPGSLIFANCGVSLGFARILRIRGCIHDGWLAFDQIDDHLDQLFLLKTLNTITTHFRQIAPEGTQPNLNTGIMKTFPLIVPPIDKQRHLHRVVEQHTAIRGKACEAQDVETGLFKSMQQTVFAEVAQ